MTDFFDLLNEVVFWFYENVWMTFFDVIYNNENDYFRYTMYFVVFIGLAGFLSEVLISFIFSFRLRKLIIFSPFKLKDYKAQYQDIYPTKKLTSRFIRQRFYNRDMSVLTEKKLSVVPEKKLSLVPEKKISVIPYNVLNLRERRALIPRLFTVPEFRLYSALDLRHFESEVARSYHSIQEKDINERYDDSKRFSGLESNLTPRYLDYALHPILTYRAISFVRHNRAYLTNIYNSTLRFGDADSISVSTPNGIQTKTAFYGGVGHMSGLNNYLESVAGKYWKTMKEEGKKAYSSNQQ